MPLSNSHGLISSLRHMSAAWHSAPALDASLTRILAPGVHGWTVLFELGFKSGSYGGQTSSIHHLLSQASLASFTSHSFHLLNILNQPYLLSEMPRCCNSDLLSYPLDSLHKNFSLLLQTLLQHHLRCLSLHLHLQSHPIPLLILINVKGRPWLKFWSVWQKENRNMRLWRVRLIDKPGRTRRSLLPKRVLQNLYHVSMGGDPGTPLACQG